MSNDGCPSCGYVNPLGARFCSSCGVALTQSSDEATMAHELVVSDRPDSPELEILDVPEGTIAVFVVLEGPKRGSRIALGGENVVIGRHPESDIFFDDVTVSRSHAVVTRVGGQFEVADDGSLNGTYVNQERVEKAILGHGDEVQVGKFKLVYMSVGDAV